MLVLHNSLSRKMSHRTQFDNDDDDNEELSSNENDDDFEADIQALRRACMVTNNDSTDFNSMTTATADAGDCEAAHHETDSDDDVDIALVRDLKNRLTEDLCEPLSMKTMCALPPEFSDDDDEDDFEILRAIHRRFSAYDHGTLKNNSEEILRISEQVHASSTNSEMENYNSMCVNISVSKGFPDSKDAGSITYLLSDNVENQPSGSDEWHESDAQRSSMWPVEHSSFPKSAQLFVDAIKRNRSYQKFLRSKFTEIEARIEENKQLRERIKVFKDFQVSCRKITGRSLSQMKDPRVQLISAKKFGTSKDSEVDDKKNVSMNYGPAENSQVANYILALIKCPLTFRRKKWSKVEKENLGKGIRQQFQETVLQVSVDQFGGLDGSSGDKNSIDNILASIKDLEITPEKIREFLPKVNWDQLSSSYVAGRTGAECEARWLNFEDPLINCNPWTVEEDKNLLFIVQEKGITNWFDIAVLLGTNRTPFQCLKRYQRSLNASILKREWTSEEDEKLRIAVEAFGEGNWQPVASALKGRTGTQCSNRWNKSLHPARQRVGRWTLDEDKRLKVAVMLFGPKSWRKIAQFVPGRTQVQCRERWVNALDPSLNFGEWTEDEDSRLIKAIQEHRHCWSKVAACMPSRTDSQCLRRWKVLLPDEVPLLQEARRMQKAALICNFVDRELERPALGPNDFVPLPTIGSVSEPEFENSLKKRKRKSRGRLECEKEKENKSCNLTRTSRSKRPRQEARAFSEGVLGVTNNEHHLVVNNNERDAILNHKSRKLVLKQKTTNQSSVESNCSEPAQEHLVTNFGLTSLMLTNGKRVESFVGTNSTNKKKFRKSHSKTSKSKPDENNDIVGSILPGVADCVPNTGDVTLTCYLSKVSRKRKTLAKSSWNGGIAENILPCISQSNNLTDVQVVVAKDKEPGGKDMVKGGIVPGHESMNLNLEGDTEACDDVTLACFLSKASKRRKTLAKSDSNGEGPSGKDLMEGGIGNGHKSMNLNLEGGTEAGDVTLACLLSKASEKRRKTLAKRGNNGGIAEDISSCMLQSGILKDMQIVMKNVRGPDEEDMVKGGIVLDHESGKP